MVRSPEQLRDGESGWKGVVFDEFSGHVEEWAQKNRIDVIKNLLDALGAVA